MTTGRKHRTAAARAELAAVRSKAMPTRHRQRLAHLAASPAAQPLIEHLDRLRTAAQTIVATADRTEENSVSTDRRSTATRDGVRDAWDFWLSQHDVSVPETIEVAVRQEAAAWLNAHSDELIQAIAKTEISERRQAALGAELERERESRLAWAIEADRLDVENERLRGELGASRPTTSEAAAS